MRAPLAPARVPFAHATARYRSHTTCGWKGRADYHTLKIGDATVEDCAWSYPSTKSGAKHIEGFWAFYTGTNGITVKGARG